MGPGVGDTGSDGLLGNLANILVSNPAPSPSAREERHRSSLKDIEFFGSGLLTQNLVHSSFKIEHTGSLIVSRDFIGSTVEYIELLQEAWVRTIMDGSYQAVGCPGVCEASVLDVWTGLSNEL